MSSTPGVIYDIEQDELHSQINRIKGLSLRLKNKLVSLGLLSAGNHTLAEEVAACRNITNGSSGSLRMYTHYQGSPACPTLTPESPYVGFSRVTIKPHNIDINSDVILEDHKILGISGSGILGYEGPRVYDLDYTNGAGVCDSSTLLISANIQAGNGNYYLLRFRQLLIYKISNDGGSSDPYANGKRVIMTASILDNGDGTYAISATSVSNTNPAQPGNPLSWDCSQLLEFQLRPYSSNLPYDTQAFEVTSTQSDTIFDGLYRAVLIF